MAWLRSSRNLLVVGILVGVLYGLLMHWLFNEIAAMASVTYLFFIPAALGAIPLLFANEQQIRSYRVLIFIPWVTILSFFLVAFALRIEVMLCLLLLASPFFLAATAIAFVVRLVKLKKEHRNKTLTGLFFLPVILTLVEREIEVKPVTYRVSDSVLIAAPVETIWSHVVAVDSIRPEEYTVGFFQWAGAPRPVCARVTGYALHAQRIGTFDNGLRFIEQITHWEPHKKVAFRIQVDPTTLGDHIFEQHVLTGNYFKFVDAAYALKPVSANTVQLTLSSSYTLSSTVNFYGSFWGDLFLHDFQQRLLEVIGKRCVLKGRPPNYQQPPGLSAGNHNIAAASDSSHESPTTTSPRPQSRIGTYR